MWPFGAKKRRHSQFKVINPAMLRGGGGGDGPPPPGPPPDGDWDDSGSAESAEDPQEFVARHFDYHRASELSPEERHARKTSKAFHAPLPPPPKHAPPPITRVVAAKKFAKIIHKKAAAAVEHAHEARGEPPPASPNAPPAANLSGAGARGRRHTAKQASEDNARELAAEREALAQHVFAPMKAW